MQSAGKQWQEGLAAEAAAAAMEGEDRVRGSGVGSREEEWG